jgi:DNA-binding LacI/PurR family transcriptional regulator
MRHRPRTRPPVKQHNVLASLRSRIVRGEWKPGDRLPTRSQLEQMYDVSGVTIQRALDQLTADGFVYARGRNGTFVASNLPNRTRYGILFSVARADTWQWRRFWTLLDQQLPIVERTRGLQLPAYYGVRHVEAEDFRRLREDLRAHRLAGLILTSSRCAVPGTFLTGRAEIPRVLVGQSSLDLGFPQINLNTERWMQRALDRLVEMGRRRIAIVSHGGLADELHYEAKLHRWFKDRGLEFLPCMHQCSDLSFPRAADNLVQLMVRQPEKVDGLIVTDEHLVEQASAGLITAGARVPDDIAVVAHCNFPCPRSQVLKIIRLGYDANQLLDLCIDLIDRQKEGTVTEPRFSLEPLFEDELDAARAAATRTLAVSDSWTLPEPASAPTGPTL